MTDDPNRNLQPAMDQAAAAALFFGQMQQNNPVGETAPPQQPMQYHTQPPQQMQPITPFNNMGNGFYPHPNFGFMQHQMQQQLGDGRNPNLGEQQWYGMAPSNLQQMQPQQLAMMGGAPPRNMMGYTMQQGVPMATAARASTNAQASIPVPPTTPTATRTVPTAAPTVPAPDGTAAAGATAGATAPAAAPGEAPPAALPTPPQQQQVQAQHGLQAKMHSQVDSSPRKRGEREIVHAVSSSLALNMATVIPHKNDVLSGRGKVIDIHHGNQQFRSMIDAQRPKFVQIKRKEKRAFALKIMQDLSSLEPPGRFLVESEGVAPSTSSENHPIKSEGVDPLILSKVWVIVAHEKVVAKVLHRLREIKSEEHLELQPQTTGPTFRMDTAMSNATVNIMQQRAHNGANATEGGSLDKEVGMPLDESNSQNNSTGFLHSPQHDTSIATIPISVHEWINKAITVDACRESSRNDGRSYLLSTVDLALVLTKHLLGSLGKWVDLKLEDITSDNLTILVKPELLALSQLANQLRPEIMGVKFHFEDALPFMSFLCHANNDTDTNCPVDLHQVCASLGNILLEIFSKGQSLSTKVSHADLGNGSTNDDSTGSTQNEDNKSQSIFDGLARFLNENKDDHGSTNNNSPAMRSTQNGNNESQGTIDLLDDCEDGHEVAAKRMAALSLSSDSLCDKAKKLLVDVGAPLSICRLVCDLLDTVNDKPSSNSTSHIDLEQALRDLTQMKDNPQMFLFDRTSPNEALDDTQLFGNGDGGLFGREEEVDALMNIKNNMSRHVRGDPQDVNGSTQSTLGGSFFFEAAFLAGYAGSGKSCLLRSLINNCEKDKWFVLKCKFDSKSVPLGVIAKAFDDFFGGWALSPESPSRPCDPSMLESFHQVCQTIFSAIDGDSFGQLCGMIPNLSRIFPRGSASGSIQGLSSEGAAGAAEKRLVYLINSLLQALCSSGRPVLLALDDLQWSDSVVMRGLSSFDVIHMNGESTVRQGLMIAGTYRSNEVKEGGDILETIDLIKNSDQANLTMLNVDGLSEEDINQLISAKIGLPLRYTLDLATLVHRKTKGNPFFVIQFLKTIINNKMLQFSVRQRRWTWDCDTIDLQMISDGVAELLTATFDRLPAQLMQTLKIFSLFGNQIHASTVDQMNSEQQVLSFDMKSELDLAVKEGLLEKAGPLYAFSHDLIHQTLYDSMSAGSRSLLHKVVGNRLLECSEDDNHSIHLLAVDQINVFLNDGEDDQLSHEEQSEYSRANAVAAHYAMAGSSFEKARLYVDMGIKLLQPGHWEDQYTLSRDLYEMSASLSYICGDTTNMASCLNESILHAKTFKDTLNASAMLARLLTSSHKHNEAIINCLDILAKLGEGFPPEPDLTMVQNKLSDVQPSLLTLAADRMKALPTMTDTNKLQAMKFLGMLCEISLMAAPILLPLLSIRMIELTFQFGFCSDSILGIFCTAFSMFLFTDDVPLAYQVGKVGVTLREESQHKHILRSKLIWVWEGNMKRMIEPLQAGISEYPSLFKSAMLVGDVQNAMRCRFLHCACSLYAGEDLAAVSNHYALCIQQSAKYQQQVVLNMAMAWYRVLVQLSGQDANNVKSFDELYQIGKESNNAMLVFNVIVTQMCVHFWFRDYTAIMKLCEKHPAPAAKRLITTMRCLFEGIAALNLARQQPNEPKYRVIGEEAVKDMFKFEQMNKWSFEHRSLLLQAELYYLNQDYEAAEHAYIASIKSAKDHKFMNDEAMANELFGMFCIDNQKGDKGTKHLRIALDLYKQWGAMNKAANLEKFIEAKTSVDAPFA